MEFFVDSGELGSDRNSGTHRRSPRKTLAGAAALVLKSGDRVLIRQGSMFNGSLAWIHNGVTLSPYTLGTESDAMPTLTLPRKGTTGIAVTGKDNTFEHVVINGAETGIFVDPQATGNTFNSPTINDYGYGILIHGSHTTLNNVSINRGRMIRNVTSEDYVGASAITLWRHENHPCEGVRVNGGVVRDAWSWRVPKTEGKDTDGDGAIVEVFGGIRDAEIVDVTGLNCKILCEIGGTKARKETVSHLRFTRCKTSGPSGKVLFINDPIKTFGIAWDHLVFDDCTFQCDGYPESPFYFDGNHGSLVELSLINSRIVAAAQIVNGGKGTRLETFHHANNVFTRVDGSKNLGFALSASDRFEMA